MTGDLCAGNKLEWKSRNIAGSTSIRCLAKYVNKTPLFSAQWVVSPGMVIGTSEAETFWTEFLRNLARRGLRGV